MAESITRSDYAELTDIILELEEFMFWNSGNKDMTHLVVATHTDNSVRKWEGRSHNMAKKVNAEMEVQQK